MYNHLLHLCLCSIVLLYTERTEWKHLFPADLTELILPWIWESRNVTSYMHRDSPAIDSITFGLFYQMVEFIFISMGSWYAKNSMKNAHFTKCT